MSIFSYFRRNKKNGRNEPVETPPTQLEPQEPRPADLGYRRLEERQVLNASFSFAAGVLTLDQFDNADGLTYDQVDLDIGSGVEDVYTFDLAAGTWAGAGIPVGDFQITGGQLAVATSIFGVDAALDSTVIIDGQPLVGTDNISIAQADPLSQVEFESLQLSNLTNVDTSIDLNVVGDVSLTNVSIVDSDPGDLVFADADIIVQAEGDITVAGAVTNQIDDAAATISLTATGDDSDVAIDESVETLEGDISVEADDEITFGASGVINAQDTGNVSLMANATDTDGDDTDGIIMTDGSQVDAGSGTITLTADGVNGGNIVIASLSTTNATANAIDISTSQGVLDGGISDVDIVASSTDALVTISAESGIGTGDAIETNVYALDAQNASTNGIRISEVAAGGSIRLVQVNVGSNNGSIVVDTADGSIIVEDSAFTPNNGSFGVQTVNGDITLTANDADASGDSDITIENSISTTNGSVTISAENDVAFLSTGSVTAGGTGNVSIEADSDTDSDGLIDMDDLAIVNAGSGTITLSASENITIGSLQTTNATADAVRVTSTAGAVRDGGDTNVDIIADSAGALVTISAAAGIGAAGEIETQINALDANNSTSNGIQISEVAAGGDLLLVNVDVGSTNGNIGVTTANGSITVEDNAFAPNNGAFGIQTVNGNISLTANDSDASNDSDLIIENTIQTTNGDVVLSAENDVRFLADGDVTASGTGNVSVEADSDSDAAGLIDMDDDAIIDGGGGTIELVAPQDITLGSLQTTNATDDAVRITSTAGAVLDGGDTNVDIVADSVGALVTISATSGIGAADEIETQINALDATNTTSDGIQISEVAAGGDISLVNVDVDSANGEIVVSTANGSITVQDNAFTPNNGAFGIQTVNGDITLTANQSDIVVENSVSMTDGNVSLVADNDVSFLADGDITASGTGNVSVVADNDTDTNGLIDMASGAVVDSGSGTISFTASEDITITSLVTTNATNAAVTITTDGSIVDGDPGGSDDVDILATSGRVVLNAGVDIGTVGGVGDFFKTTAADLNPIETNTAELDLTAGNAISIDELNPASVIVQSSATTAFISSAGDINFTDAAPTVTNLALISGGTVNLPNTLTVTGDLRIEGATDVEAADLSIDLFATRLLFISGQAETINTTVTQLDVQVDGDLVVNNAGDLELIDLNCDFIAAQSLTAAGSVTIDAAGFEMTVTDDVIAGPVTDNSSTGNVLLTSDVINVNDVVLADNGNITLTAADTVNANADGILTTVQGNISVTATTGQIVLADGSLIIAGRDIAANYDPALPVVALDGAATNGGTVSLSADGNITLGSVQTTNATASAISIASTNGAVVDGGGSDVDVIADSVGALTTISAANGIGAGNPLETQINALDATNSTNNGIQIAEVAAGGDISLVNVDVGSTDGNIGVTTANGSITVEDGAFAPNNGAFGIETIDGNVALTANDSDASNDSDVIVENTIVTVEGDVTLTAENDVTFTADGDVTASGAGNIVIEADSDGDNNGFIEMADGTVVDAGSGTIRLEAAENITLGSLQTTNATVDAVRITTTGGAVIDGGDADVDIVADAAGALTTISAANGIGAGAPIETQINALDATNSTDFGIQISEVAAGGDISLVNVDVGSTDGNIGVTTANGSITVEDGAFAPNNGAFGIETIDGNVVLTANDSDASNDSNIVVENTIETVEGDVTLTAENDVTFTADGDVTASGAGNVSVTADSDNDGSGLISMANGSVIDAGSGTISLEASENITLGSLVTTNATADAVRITTTAGAVIDGGDADVDIVANEAGALTTISAANGIGAADALDTEINALDATNASTNGIRVNEVAAGGDLILVNVDVNSNAGAITINAADGTITVEDAAFTPNNGAFGVSSVNGNINLTASDANGSNDSDIVVESPITTTNGNVSLTAENDVRFTAAGDVLATGTGNVSVRADSDNDGNGSIDMADGTAIDAGSGTITLRAAENITLGSVQTTNATADAVRITTTAGAVIDGGNADVDIVADSVGALTTIIAANGIGAGDAIETQINALDATNSTNNGIQISETAAGEDISLVNVDVGSADGNLGVTTANGSITVEDGAFAPNNGAFGIETVNGDIVLTAADSDASNDSNIVVENTIETVEGNVTLTAENDVTFTADGDVTATGAGNVSVQADSDGDGSGLINMADGAVIDGGSGMIELSASEDITLGSLVTTNATANAVDITTTSGAVIDGGDTDLDIVANNTGAVTNISAANGIGDGDKLDTQIAQANLTVTGTGDIGINEQDGIILDNLLTADGSIEVMAAGNIAAVDVQANGATANVDLMTTTGGIDVTLVAADQNVTIDADAGDVTTGSVTAVDGSVTITADAGNVSLGIISADNVLAPNVAVSITAFGNIVDGDPGGSDDLDILASNGRVVLVAGGDIGAVGGAGDFFKITEADLNPIETNTAELDVTAGNAIAINELNPANTIVQATATTAFFVNAGDVSFGDATPGVTNLALLAGGTVNLPNTLTVAGDLRIEGATDVAAADGSIDLFATRLLFISGQGETINTTVSQLDATANGNLVVNNSADLELIDLNCDLIAAQSVAAAGSVTVNTTGFDLTVTDDVIAGPFGDNNSTGNVTLTGDVINVNDFILADNGNITVTAVDTGNVAATGVLATVQGNISITATTGQIVLADGSLVIAGRDIAATYDPAAPVVSLDVAATDGGTISLTAANDVTLSSLQTNNATGDAVCVTSSAGAIIDGGDTDTDIVADSVGALATLSAATGIGEPNALETQINALDATNTTANGIRINELASGGDLSIVNADVASATGEVNITTADGTITVEDGGFTPNNGAFGIATVNGAVNLTANDADSSEDSNLVVENSIATVGGDVELIAENDVTFTAAGDVSSTSGDVSVTADSDNDGAGLINMADGAVINAGTGTIDLSASENITLGSLQTNNATADAVRVTTTTGAVIDGGDADVDIVADSAGALVSINAVNGIGSANAIETQINALDANNTTSNGIQISEVAAGGDISLVNVDVGSVNGDIQVTTENGSITVEEDGFAPNNGSFGIETVNGDITLTTNDSDASNDSDVVVENTIETVQGDVTLAAENDVTFTAAGDVTASGAGNVAVTADADNDGSGAIEMADGTIINAGTGTISLTASEDITLGSLQTDNATVDAVRITTSGGAVIDGGDTDTDIVADTSGALTTISAANGIGDPDALETRIHALDATNSTVNGIRINEIAAGGDLSLVNVDANSVNGEIVINTADGTITVEDSGFAPNNGAFGISSVDGAVNLTASDADATNDSDLIVENTITTADGDVNLTAENDVTFTADGDVTANGVGDVSVIADSDADGNGLIDMADGAVINAGTGTITLNASEDITLGSLETNNGTADAVRITTTAGAVVDGGDTDDDIVADAAGALVTINAVSGIGAGDPLETQINALDATNSTSDGIEIVEVAGGGDISLVNVDVGSTDGVINVTTENGSITVEDNAFAPNNGTFGIQTVDGDITLIANDSDATNDSDINVENTIDTTEGNVVLTAENDVTFTADGDVTASGAGVVNVTADSDTDGSGGIDMADGSVINSGPASINLSASEDITLGSLVTNNATANAINITTTGGAVIDGGDADLDIVANNPGAITNITAANGIGEGDKLDTQIHQANLTVTGTGGIGVNELDAIVLDNLLTNDGSIEVMAGGNIDAVDVDANGATADVNLMTTSGGITVGTINADQDVILDADAGDITTGDIVASTGLVDINADNGDVTIGSISAGTTVNINATLGSINDAQDDQVQDISAGLNNITLTAADEIGGNSPAGNTNDADGRIELADGSVVDASSTNSGDVFLSGLGTINLLDVDTNDGAINVVAQGTILATDVQTNEAIDNNDNSADVTLESLTDAIVVSLVTSQDNLDFDAATSITDTTNATLTAEGRGSFVAPDAITLVDELGDLFVVDLNASFISLSTFVGQDGALASSAATANVQFGSLTVNDGSSADPNLDGSAVITEDGGGSVDGTLLVGDSELNGDLALSSFSNISNFDSATLDVNQGHSQFLSQTSTVFLGNRVNDEIDLNNVGVEATNAYLGLDVGDGDPVNLDGRDSSFTISGSGTTSSFGQTDSFGTNVSGTMFVESQVAITQVQFGDPVVDRTDLNVGELGIASDGFVHLSSLSANNTSVAIDAGAAATVGDVVASEQLEDLADNAAIFGSDVLNQDQSISVVHQGVMTVTQVNSPTALSVRTDLAGLQTIDGGIFVSANDQISLEQDVIANGSVNTDVQVNMLVNSAGATAADIVFAPGVSVEVHDNLNDGVALGSQAIGDVVDPDNNVDAGFGTNGILELNPDGSADQSVEVTYGRPNEEGYRVGVVWDIANQVVQLSNAQIAAILGVDAVFNIEDIATAVIENPNLFVVDTGLFSDDYTDLTNSIGTFFANYNFNQAFDINFLTADPDLAGVRQVGNEGLVSGIFQKFEEYSKDAVFNHQFNPTVFSTVIVRNDQNINFFAGDLDAGQVDNSLNEFQETVEANFDNFVIAVNLLPPAPEINPVVFQEPEPIILESSPLPASTQFDIVKPVQSQEAESLYYVEVEVDPEDLEQVGDEVRLRDPSKEFKDADEPEELKELEQNEVEKIIRQIESDPNAEAGLWYKVYQETGEKDKLLFYHLKTGELPQEDLGPDSDYDDANSPNSVAPELMPPADPQLIDPNDEIEPIEDSDSIDELSTGIQEPRESASASLGLTAGSLLLASMAANQSSGKRNTNGIVEACQNELQQPETEQGFSRIERLKRSLFRKLKKKVG